MDFITLLLLPNQYRYTLYLLTCVTISDYSQVATLLLYYLELDYIRELFT